MFNHSRLEQYIRLNMLRYCIIYFSLFFSFPSFSQLTWKNIDSLYQPLPKSVHVYFTNDRIEDTAPFLAYYLIADLKDKHLNFTTDTTYKRRLTPKQFYEKDQMALAVVNCSFFNFDQNKILNLIVRNGKLIAYNSASLKGTGKDTTVYKIPFRSAIGIDSKRNADIAWTYTDSAHKYPSAFQTAVLPIHTTHFNTTPHVIVQEILKDSFHFSDKFPKRKALFEVYKKKWKMQTAVGGGPSLLWNGEVVITNEEEMMFTGKAINDKHPRTAMGYTKDNKLIILVVQGRSESGSGASLIDEAVILKNLGCIEALNLDGGGSSCLLINGKETISVSDKKERAVPAVFLIKTKN